MSTAIRPSERPLAASRAGPVGTPVVVGLDLGTTSAKVVAVDSELRLWATTANAYALQSPRPGWAEQDPQEVVDAARRGLRDVIAAVHDHGAVVAGVSLGAAMHSILAVDDAGVPLTPAITYADGRAAGQAAALRGTAQGRGLYERTGVPHHPMAPLFKLAWFAEHAPDIAARAARWVSLKEYLLAVLGADVVVDHSIASGTGMFELLNERWADQALTIAGVSAAQLSPLVPSTTVVAAAELDIPVVVGAGDGALANVGAGALADSVAALSIGTSGAVRIATREPRTDPQARMFCSALDGRRWVVGGAISNGGIVLRWLRDRLFRPAAADIGYADLTALADQAPPGSDGLLWLPYLTAERAPQWDGRVGGALFGLDLRHGAGHIVRAGMEAVAFQLRWVTEAMAETGCEIQRIHATGGFTASPVWVQVLADVLGREIVIPLEAEGSSLGAVLLGLVALDMVDSLDAAAARVPLGQVVAPRPDHTTVYDDAYVRFRQAQDRL